MKQFWPDTAIEWAALALLTICAGLLVAFFVVMWSPSW